MKLQRLIALPLLVVLASCFSTHQAIAQIVAKESEMNVGISVVSMRSKRVLLAQNVEKLFAPSSAMKLFTIAAALHHLGPHFRFRTEVLGVKKGNTIQHLYLKSSGDPSFSSTDLANLVTELRQLGITKITGNVVIDAFVFDDVPYGSGWMLDDMNEGYSAPVTGLSVDHNRIAFGFFAGAKSGAPLGLTMFPQTHYFDIDNSAVTSAAGTRPAIAFSLVGKQGITKGAKVGISGQLPVSSTTKYESLAINDPIDFAGFLIAEELKRSRISFTGKIVRARVPDNTPRLTMHVSSPLSEMAIDFVKMSNNHATEMLLKKVGEVAKGAPGTFENGLAAVRAFLQDKTGATLKSATLADGSGLSRYNQMSAKHFTDLLTFMWSDFRTGPEFVASLALFGEDGTLKDGKGNGLIGNIRAKTGSMTSLRSLAGYMKQDDGDVLAFAIMTSGSNQAKQKLVIEDILTSLKKRS